MNYDKLKNLETFSTPFSFECPSCKCNGLKKGNWEIKPIGIAWKPDDVDNSDIKDKQVRAMLDRRPTLRQALLEAVSNSVQYKPLLVMCKCDTPISNTDDITKSDIRKWLNINLPQTMNLKLRPDQIDDIKRRNKL